MDKDSRGCLNMRDTCADDLDEAMIRLNDETKTSAFAEDQLCSRLVEAESAEPDGQHNLRSCRSEARTCKQAVESCASAKEDTSAESTFVTDALRSCEGTALTFARDLKDLLEVHHSNSAVLMKEVETLRDAQQALVSNARSLEVQLADATMNLVQLGTSSAMESVLQGMTTVAETTVKAMGEKTVETLSHVHAKANSVFGEVDPARYRLLVTMASFSGAFSAVLAMKTLALLTSKTKRRRMRTACGKCR